MRLYELPGLFPSGLTTLTTNDMRDPLTKLGRASAGGFRDSVARGQGAMEKAAS